MFATTAINAETASRTAARAVARAAASLLVLPLHHLLPYPGNGLARLAVEGHRN